MPPLARLGYEGRVRHWIGVAMVALASAVGCGESDHPCASGGTRLEILAPVDGESVGIEDDADPDMGGLQYELAVLACGFEPGAQIVVWVRAPFDTVFAFLEVEAGSDVARGVVPLVPGELTLEATDADESIQSPPVTFTVTLE